MRLKLLTITILFFFFEIKAQKRPDFLVNYNKEWVDKTFNSLSLDQKIGQLLMPRGNISGKGYDPEKLKKWVKDYQLGGIVFFAGQPSTQARIVNDLQSLSKVPMLIGMDLEWGMAMRLDSSVRFPYQLALGSMQGGDDLIYDMGVELGKQCKRMGVHINYAPVVDINSNPKNPVINFRSFGEDKFAVANKALAYMNGMQSQNLLSTAKHFPGHGDTGVDSHHDLPVITGDIKHMNENEFFPYKYLIANGISGIMTSHLSVPALEKTPNIAATFSENILKNILRTELKFEGLTFTDAMDMQGAIKFFPNGDALVRAILAGNDILETFEDVPNAIKTIKEAVASKKLSMEILDARVKKILMAKSWAGLDNYKPIVINNLIEDLNTEKSDLINRKMAEKLLVCLKNNEEVLPIKDLSKITQIVSIDAEKETFFQQMAAKYTLTENINFSVNETDDSQNNKLSKINKDANLVIGLHLQNIRPGQAYGLNPKNQKLVNQLLNSHPKAILAIFGNHYVLDKIDNINQAKGIILAGQLTKYTEEAAAMAIFGGIETSGRLPVNVNTNFKLGDGYTLAKMNRLAYGTPEMVGINSKILTAKVDSVINAGLDAKAYPGAVLQINKDGRVIYQKAYGNHTYEAAEINKKRLRAKPNIEKSNMLDAMDNFSKPSPIANNINTPIVEMKMPGEMHIDDIFDMASVTKISTSALAIMQLKSAGKFDLDAKFSDYVPNLRNTNKADLSFRNMLTHRSGLKAWIPFWMDCVDTTATIEKAIGLKLITDNELVKINHKQTVIQKLFKKTPKYHFDYAQSILKNKDLWAKALKQNTITWKPNIFSNIKSDEYNVEVADSLFLHKDYEQTIKKQIADSPVNTAQGYVYSDLHYYYYPEIIKNITGKTWENYLGETYKTIGAHTLGFNPRNKFGLDRIVPTENEILFRKTLIHGRVHDEGAGMLNGLSGHAGLFGSANDLSKLMQLYLQKGKFGNTQYFDSKVLNEFSDYQFPYENNRRAIAFDKLDFDKKIANGPQLASKSSFGHSGYTGTFTWLDPSLNLSYVFLSNRVYPTRDNVKISTLNIRTEIGNQIIKTISQKP